MAIIINKSDFNVTGTYTGVKDTSYKVEISQAASNSTFKWIRASDNRSFWASTTSGSPNISIKKVDSDGNLSSDSVNFLYVGDKITGTGIPANSYIVAVTGTEGSSVTIITIGNNATATGDVELSNSAQWSSSINHTSYIGSGNVYNASSTEAQLHGIGFYWTRDIDKAQEPGQTEKGIYEFTAYTSLDHAVNTMIPLTKNSTYDLLGWTDNTKSFVHTKDTYAEGTDDITGMVSDISYAYSEEKPTMSVRGDDVFVGRGPNARPLYIGYPQVTQFGQKAGSQLISEDGVCELNTIAVPNLEQFMWVGKVGSKVDPGSTSQIMVGYTKDSDMLLKITKGEGVIETYSLGGNILGMTLDNSDDTKIWVMYKSGNLGEIRHITVGDASTAMSINDNRIYRFSNDTDTNTSVPSLNEEDVVLSDIEYLDNRIYISASDRDYDTAAMADCVFNTGSSDRDQFIWRSDTLPDTSGGLPDIGYTALNMTNITPNLRTSSTTNNGNVLWRGISYEYTWNWDDESGEGSYVKSSNDASRQGWFGGGSQHLRLRVAPAKRGLITFTDKTGSESIALYVSHTDHTPRTDNGSYGTYEYRVSGNQGAETEDDDGEKYTRWFKAGPLVYQNNKAVKLGSHFMVFHDSENVNAGDIPKRINVTSGASKGDGTVGANGTGTAYDVLGVAQYGADSDLVAHTVCSGNIDSSGVKLPRGIAISDTSGSVYWWGDLDESGTPNVSLTRFASSNLSGLQILDNSITTFRKFTSQFNNDSPVKLQAMNVPPHWNPNNPTSHILSGSSSGSDFSVKYTTTPNSGSAWSSFSMQATLDITVSALASAPKDLNNLLISASTNNADTDYHKNFYKISLLYDGFQESILSQSVYGTPGQSMYGWQIEIKVLKDKIPKRLSHINVYRGKAIDADATDAETDYLMVQSIPLDGQGWVQDGEYLKYTFKDNKGKNFGSYEALTGVSPMMSVNHLNYGVSEQCKGYLFVTDANNTEINNVENYIFRSKPGKFSIFNWANEYVALPEKPLVLKSFNNLLYAFSAAKIYIINPDNLQIVDSMDGNGCLDPESAIVTEYGMFFADNNGVYIHNGRQASIISLPIQDSDNSILSSYSWGAVDWTTYPPKLAFDGVRKALLAIFPKPGSETTNSLAWVYTLTSKRWDLWEFDNLILSTATGKFGEIVASDGNLIQIGTGTTRKAWEFQSKKITAGYDTYDKSFKEIHAEGSSALPDITYKTSGISTWQSLNSDRISSSYKKAKWLQVKVEDTTGDKTLDSIGIHLRPLKARSSKI